MSILRMRRNKNKVLTGDDLNAIAINRPTNAIIPNPTPKTILSVVRLISLVSFAFPTAKKTSKKHNYFHPKFGVILEVAVREG